jgi:hypothetical protein
VRVPSLMVIGLAVLSVAQPSRRLPGTAARRRPLPPTSRSRPLRAPISATIQIHIRRYTPDFDRTALENALQHGGYASFVTALRKAPEVGSVAAGDGQFTIRWAREQKTAKGAGRVKPGGETGVRIDDYADEPLTLVKVTRKTP